MLWIDEIEKAFSGSKSSGNTDGGTSGRVLGSFLSWLQEKTSPVFVVATANDVSQLPSELLRKGRFDEIFYVDLPTTEERKAIWEIQIAKYGRSPADFDLSELARASGELTGSEVEQVFIDALYCAFSSEQEPSMKQVQACLEELVPLSQLMGEQITALRKWAQGRTRPAATQKTQKGGKHKRQILY